jgi:hypothetical protein
MLQSKAGYIDARPLTASSAKPLATHGRTIHWVTSVVLCKRRLPCDFRYAPFATEVLWRRNMSRRAKSRHPSRDGTFEDRVVTSSIDPCRSWVYNLRPGTPPWQLGQGRLERLLYPLYGEYAEDGGPRDSHATTHPVCP